MKSRSSRPAPSHSSASAPRFASFSAWSGNGGAPMRSLSSSGDRDAGPAEVRRHQQATACCRRGRAARSRRRRSPAPARPPTASASAASSREVAEHVVDRAAAVVDRRERAVALVAGEVRGARRRGSRRRSPARARRRRAAQLDRQRRAADRAAQLDLGLAHEAEVDQLADEARHRRLVQPGLLGDRGAGARRRGPRRDAAPRRGCGGARSAGWPGRGGGRAWARRDPNGSGGSVPAGFARGRSQAPCSPSTCASSRSPASSAAAAVTSSSVWACASHAARSSAASATSPSTSSDTASRRGCRPSGSPSSSSSARNQPVCSRSAKSCAQYDQRRPARPPRAAAGPGGPDRASAGTGAPRALSTTPPSVSRCDLRGMHKGRGATGARPVGTARVRRPAAHTCPCPLVRSMLRRLRRARLRHAVPLLAALALALSAWPELPVLASRERAAAVAGRPADLLRRVRLVARRSPPRRGAGTALARACA